MIDNRNINETRQQNTTNKTSIISCTKECEHLFGEVVRTLAFLTQAFATLSRLACAVVQLLRSRHRGYPYKLFRLLGPELWVALTQMLAASCLTQRACLTPSQLRYGRFRQRLKEQRTLAILKCIALLARLDTARIECRHAALRRIIRKSQAWAAGLLSASSDFFLLRQRVCGAREHCEEASTCAEEEARRRGWCCASFLQQ